MGSLLLQNLRWGEDRSLPELSIEFRGKDLGLCQFRLIPDNDDA